MKNCGKQLVCVVREKGEGKQKVESSIIENILNLLLKIFALGNDNGTMGNLCCIAALKDMPEESFFESRVTGLSHSMTVAADSQDGFLYFCKSKGGNAAMWRHIFLTYVIPTIKRTAEHHQTKHLDGSDMEPFLHTDGEANIMNEAFDPVVMAAFKAASINFQKGGPSHTSKTQELDCGHTFDALKAGVVGVANNCTNVKCDVLRRSMLGVLTKFRHDFSNVPITAEFWEKIVYTLEVVVFSTQKHWNANKMRESAKVTGIHQDVAPGECTVNYDRVMTRHLNTTTTPEEYTLMKEKRWEVAAMHKAAGRITNEQLDQLGIAKTEGSVDRDLLTLCRRDAEMITHIDSIARHQDWVQKKAIEKQDAIERKAAAEQEVERQRVAALDIAAVVLGAYINDMAQDTSDSENATWKQRTVTELTAFYRTINWSIAATPKPTKQPSVKKDWITLLTPHLAASAAAADVAAAAAGVVAAVAAGGAAAAAGVAVTGAVAAVGLTGVAAAGVAGEIRCEVVSGTPVRIPVVVEDEIFQSNVRKLVEDDLRCKFCDTLIGITLPTKSSNSHFRCDWSCLLATGKSCVGNNNESKRRKPLLRTV